MLTIGNFVWHGNFWRPTKPSGLRAWWTADDVYTLSCSRLPDNSGNSKYLTAGNNQTSPMVVSGSIFNNGQKAIWCDAFGLKKLFAGSAGDWNYLHDGTGCTVAVTCMPTSTGSTCTILNTQGSTTGVGFTLFHNGTNDSWNAQVRGVGQAVILSLAGVSGSSPKNTVHNVVFTYQEGLSPEAQLRVNGVVVASGSTTGLPTGSNSLGNLAIGVLSAANLNFFNGYFRQAAIWNRVLSGSEIQTLESRFANQVTPRSVKRVWTVGDSITNGTYQPTFWFRVTQSTGSLMVDMLGTLFGGGTSLFLDVDHDGHFAHTCAMIQNVITGNLGAVPTDTVIIAGTNDVLGNVTLAAVTSSFISLVNSIKQRFPSSYIWLARPPRLLTVQSASMEAFASWISSYAPTIGASYIDTDVASNAEISGDNIHPNSTGYTTIGNKVADALGF